MNKIRNVVGLEGCSRDHGNKDTVKRLSNCIFTYTPYFIVLISLFVLVNDDARVTLGFRPMV